MTIVVETSTVPARHVLCMKWGQKYSSDYVNRLYAMVRRHLPGPFEFICLTDNPAGIRTEVTCLPIPPLDLPLGIPERGWKKLGVFQANLYDRQGVALFLDLDVVITGDLTPFFDHPGEFLIIHDYKRPWRITGNSSVFRFNLGAHADVLENFKAQTDQIRKQFRNEQAYLSDHLHRQGQLSYWPATWCPSFKYHCIPSWPRNYWQEPLIPQGARVVIFHGECNPPDALVGRRNRRFRVIRPAKWIHAHWRE